jgi:DNA recombination protein RmuC
VVHLAGGKNVVVDAKVPLDAFLDACEVADDPDGDARRADHLRRHARQLRQHVDALAGKTYWRALGATPEFVVLFVPGESFLSAALESDHRLLEYAADRHVVLATPTTLIALLRTVAYAWRQEALTRNAMAVHTLGRELYSRLSTMGDHLARVGTSLGGAVASYNRAVGSLEARVMVSARKLAELGVTADDLVSPAQVEVAPRQLADALAEPSGQSDERLLERGRQ